MENLTRVMNFRENRVPYVKKYIGSSDSDVVPNILEEL